MAIWTALGAIHETCTRYEANAFSDLSNFTLNIPWMTQKQKLVPLIHSTRWAYMHSSFIKQIFLEVKYCGCALFCVNLPCNFSHQMENAVYLVEMCKSTHCLLNKPQNDSFCTKAPIKMQLLICGFWEITLY